MTDQTQQQQETREYTLVELDNAVAGGQITQTQRDQIWTQQVQRAAVKQAEVTARTIVETETRANTLDTQLKEYANLQPDLMKDGSPTRQRVAAEFEFLVSQGAPRDLTTELAAVRAALGPIDRMRQFRAGQRRGPDGFAETTGQSVSPQQRREEDAWSKLSAGQRAHYDKLIDRGIYPSRQAVFAELNWKRGGDNKRSQRGTA